MKVLQINCVYTGSTGKIVKEIKNHLDNNDIENAVFYGNGDISNDKNVYKFAYKWGVRFSVRQARFFGMQYSHSNFTTNKLINSIKEYNPDIVHLHCINGNWVNIYKLINYLKKHNIKTILTLHAEFMHTGNCSHALDCEKWKTGCGSCPRLKEATGSYLLDRTHHAWLRMKRSFDGFDDITIVSVSDWLKERAKTSPILQNLEHITINNGIDISTFTYYDNAFKQYKDFLSNKLILHVTPNFKDSIKGGKYVLQIAEKMPEYNFLIVGYNGDNILPNNVFTLKHTENQKQLAELYSIASCTLLTSKRETFSMIVAESLCCGTPICGFKAGGPESITIKEYSNFVNQNDTESLIKKIRSIINEQHCKVDISNAGKLKFDSKTMCEKYLNLYLSKC